MTVKGTAKLKRIMYPKGVSSTNGGFAIALFELTSVEEGKPEINDAYHTFTIKGDMPPLDIKSEYYFVIEEGERHPKFGLSYESVFMRQNININKDDEDSVKQFLRMILTERQVDSLYDTFKNPIEVIELGNIKKLAQAKYIGLKTAQRIIDRYESQKDYSYAFIELGKYDIPSKIIKKITKLYKSPELAVQKVKENPYELMKFDGYGFKKCDKLFLQLGGEPNAKIRIKSFLVSYLQDEAGKGHTWCAPRDLIEATSAYIPNVDKTLIGKILLSDDVFYVSEDKKRISLKIYQKLESLVANELHRILTSKSDIEYDGWEDYVKDVEEEQGWEFTPQQKEAMLMMFQNNISILQGFGGTGKTSTLKAVADVLEKKGYIYAQCALSGKASSNLTLVTGKEGSTIHRLLEYSPVLGGFFYNQTNKLPYDIIIVDEISMVDAKLFGHLLLAIRNGAKLIMLGDSQQLESIGIPVMMPMIESGLIPTMTLTQIHRQAQMSAIVTDSIAIRKGKQVVKETSGKVVHGELKDLEYHLIESDDKIFVEVMKEFYKHIQQEDIMDVQIFTQVREKGNNSCLAINKACQKVYNPPSNDKKQVQIGKKDTGYVLREGDKVINVKNNYNSVDENNEEKPVFNGNIGIIERFDTDENKDEFMIVDFDGIGKVKIYEDRYDTVELAYCITIHKSQGSSSKIVIIALPYHFLLNSRQLLYTAITRARKHCVVIATKKTLSLSIKKDQVSNKRTYLGEYLKNLLNKPVKQNY